MAHVKRIDSRICAQMERRRKRLGMSRPILAQRSGVSLPTVNRILSGGEEHTTYANLQAVADSLGMYFELRDRAGEQEFTEQQAKAKATLIARMVQGSSALESQAVDTDTVRQMISQTTHELMAGSKRKLWS
jgi:transcriptional regulator with XRE-family HTH domain